MTGVSVTPVNPVGDPVNLIQALRDSIVLFCVVHREVKTGSRDLNVSFLVLMFTCDILTDLHT